MNYKTGIHKTGIHKTGVQSEEQATREAVDKFNEAFNRHDADRLAALLTDDTVFEDTSPAPDGRRIEGKAAVTGAMGLSQDAQRAAVASARRGYFYGAGRESGRQTRVREGMKELERLGFYFETVAVRIPSRVDR